MIGLLRVTLAYLALAAAVPGVLATIAPSAFYDDFPLGRAWVQMLPPYNEHLIRDVGNYKVAFAILFAWAAWRPSRELVVPVCAAWSVAALLHAGYHALHLDGFGAGAGDRHRSARACNSSGEPPRGQRSCSWSSASVRTPEARSAPARRARLQYTTVAVASLSRASTINAQAT